jgi:segregation and condensation protein B
VAQQLHEIEELVITPLVANQQEEAVQTDKQPDHVTDETIRPVVEALLFAVDRPLSISRISELLDGVPHGTVREVIDEICAEYNSNDRPLTLRQVAGGYQFYTRPQYAPWLKKLYKSKSSNRLSPAALETLAIVAYKQPITRAEIEAIRGVSVSGLLSTLLERRLIKIGGRDDTIGKPLLYRTTNEFLTYFGLADVRDLPSIASLQEIL